MNNVKLTEKIIDVVSDVIREKLDVEITAEMIDSLFD